MCIYDIRCLMVIDYCSWLLIVTIPGSCCKRLEFQTSQSTTFGHEVLVKTGPSRGIDAADVWYFQPSLKPLMNHLSVTPTLTQGFRKSKWVLTNYKLSSRTVGRNGSRTKTRALAFTRRINDASLKLAGPAIGPQLADSSRRRVARVWKHRRKHRFPGRLGENNGGYPKPLFFLNQKTWI